MSASTTHSVEEKLNSATHSIGAGLSIAGMILLLVLTAQNGGGGGACAAFALYGSTQILMYLSSSFTHLFSDHPAIHRVIRIIDQVSIYLLIAGTYTPVLVLGLQGGWALGMMIAVWGLALCGILSKLVFFREKHLVSDLLYLPMGWLILVALGPLRRSVSGEFLAWVLGGGAAYTLGIVFYLFKKIPFSHVIWHLFVLTGGILFYLGFVFWLV